MPLEGIVIVDFDVSIGSSSLDFDAVVHIILFSLDACSVSAILDIALVSKLDGKPVSKKVKPTRPEPGRTSDVLNVRKAVKFASKGAGSAALARSTEKVKVKKSTKSSRKRTMKGR